MVLPPELHVYAENILRRFPEEFMALGAPNLEEIYDLRPNGTWSKKMVESSSEKTIEITMRRWSTNAYAPPVPPYAMPYGWNGAPGPAPQVWGAANAAAAAARYTQGVRDPTGDAPGTVTGSPAAPGAPPAASAATGSPVAAAQAALDDQANQRLGRLESALLALKPQIEAMVAIQSKQLTAPAPASNNLQAPRGVMAPGSICQSPTGADKGDSDAPELRLRRNLDKLQINTAPGDKAGGRPIQAPAPAVQLPPSTLKDVATTVPSANHEAKAEAPEEAAEKSVKSIKVARPTVEIPLRTPGEIPLRSSTDPQSPRSPGRFSAWK